MGWKTLEHNGICIPEPYKIQQGYIIYKNKKYNIKTELECALNLYQNSNFKKDKVYKCNFLNSIHHLLPVSCNSIDNIQIPKLKKHKTIIKKSNIYNTCIINGKKEKIDKFFADPPCIFQGRGVHSKRGYYKPGIKQENITINISKGKEIKGEWKNIIHDSNVDWIASWTDPITRKIKYIYPSVSSKLKMNDALQKFDFARQLNKNINRIRYSYLDDIKNSSDVIKQHAICTFIIDKTCIRCGSDEENNTYGCTTLLGKHVTIQNQTLCLNFVGKDSIQCKKSLCIKNMTILNLLKEYLKKCTNNTQVFSLVNHSSLNKYLHKKMPNLTAKVFRTCHASHLLSVELSKVKTIKEYQNTLALVSKLCNHTNNQTGKANYLDPRITIAFCKKHNIEISKLLSKTLLDKYQWALKAPKTFTF